MSEQYKGVKEDGTLTAGTLVIKTDRRKEKEAILKEYLEISGSVKLIKVYGREGECYEEVNI